MKVDNPRFDLTGRGELESCRECPFDHGQDNDTCKMWWFRDDNEDNRIVCPTAETYESACRLAEQAHRGEKP